MKTIVGKQTDQFGMTLLEVVIALFLFLTSVASVSQIINFTQESRIKSQSQSRISRFSEFLDVYLAEGMRRFWATISLPPNCTSTRPAIDAAFINFASAFGGFALAGYRNTNAVPFPSNVSLPAYITSAKQRCDSGQTILYLNSDISALNRITFCLTLKAVGTDPLVKHDSAFIEVDYYFLDLRDEQTKTCAQFTDLTLRNSRTGRFVYRVHWLEYRAESLKYLPVTFRGTFNASPN